jgi:hypothetical protein
MFEFEKRWGLKDEGEGHSGAFTCTYKEYNGIRQVYVTNEEEGRYTVEAI